ncbi:MAG TPA: DEAD/DEAH box helicase [Vicinamibacterales bacterium]|nr:DEAD/DEAH box helicase [Vicinamibacterales bacterium]
MPAEVDPAPVSFTTFGFAEPVMRGLADLRFAETRPIQSAVIPLVMAGHDLIACAETGTGKTLAFLLPILHQLVSAPPSPHSRALVLAPTRELAVQIEDDLHGLSYHTSVTSFAIYGGVPMDPQERALRAGADVLVATPGRLQDHMRQGAARLDAVNVLVLDEADRMMDMGFWPDVRRIIGALPANRQTLLFSATMPEEVVKLTREIVREPRYVQIGSASAPARTITHEYHLMPAAEKAGWLATFLRREEGPVLVFVRTKRGAERLALRLAGAGLRATALHADRTQEKRQAAVEGFRSGRYKVMVATDIAARGLDIDAISHVINFEVPDTIESYVHRVGRTGRSELEGIALTLVSPEERRTFAAIERAIDFRAR